MMQAEFWRDIPDTHGKYQISRAGDVRHIWPSGHISPLTPRLKLRTGGSKRGHGSRMVVHLRLDGKDRELTVWSLLCKTWLPPAPPGMCWYHKDGCQHNNVVENAALISRSELGRMTGGRSMRKSVEMVDAQGKVIALYSSAREAARANHMSLQCVVDRCEGKIKKPFELNGHSFQWEDSPGKRTRKRRAT